MNDSNLLFFDDIQIGQTFISHTYTLNEEQIKLFAHEFDPQPFHLDENAAKNTIFKGLIASGWHTAAITMRLLVKGIGHRFAGGVIGLGGEISWPNPTRPMDTLYVSSEVIEINSSLSQPERGIVKIRNHTLNQENQIVQIFIANILVNKKNG
ncbi:acyl dehydratase MaoC [Legionella donaldsonii]|uniref:Acyl dehydratase MaoC n=1 Tax=Legionella donaldsonii TaxID=45060 RepID=A0A378J1Z4_9GAMM|nr:MaoC family dehydratase [Legionella donaldsonii]STX40971.1 acyl dehydratase MaoC [Legionella donaldsonii]